MTRALLFLFIVVGSEVSAQDFLKKWDFDQDGINDTIYFEYTGGAHCCYHIRINTTSDKKTWSYNDDMDGGYVMGVDDSYPEKFNIKNYDNDSAPEILMEINSYNGEYYPGGGHILLDYHDGYFFKKDFDLYAYYRSLDSISCTGVMGMYGYYVARTDDDFKDVYLHSSGIAEYDAEPRGLASWEHHYKGKWELKDSTLTIILTLQQEDAEWQDAPYYEMKKPIVCQYVYVKSECMFRELHSKDPDYFYKE